MDKLNKIVLTLLVGLTALSFTDRQELPIAINGTYGVCDCNEDVSPVFELTLNDDHTFRYVREDAPGSGVDVSGKWVRSDNTILLKEYPADVSIHDKWKVDEQCLKSRKGFEWTRLCQVKPCR
ncbi:MAG: hypothetical protein IPL92_03475 [Saprospiraceae bacterium]|nr:hypothetical protein [Candidatus Opimibacter iunctus]